MSGFDLSALDTKGASEKGTVVHLESPATGDLLYTDGDKQPITITILGPDSDKVREFNRNAHDRRMEKARKARDFDLSLEKAETEQAQRLAVATIAWSGVMLDGAVLDCTEANARKLYGDARLPWIGEQLQKAMDDRARFFKNASAS